MTIARHTVYVRGRYCGRIVSVPSGVTRVRVTVKVVADTASSLLVSYKEILTGFVLTSQNTFLE